MYISRIPLSATGSAPFDVTADHLMPFVERHVASESDSAVEYRVSQYPMFHLCECKDCQHRLPARVIEAALNSQPVKPCKHASRLIQQGLMQSPPALTLNLKVSKP